MRRCSAALFHAVRGRLRRQRCMGWGFGMPEAAFATVRARGGRCLRPQRRASFSVRQFGFRRQRCMGWGSSGCWMLRLQPFERDADGVFDRSVGRLFQNGGSDSVGSDVWVGEFGMPEAAFATVRARGGRCLRPQRRASFSVRRFGFRRLRCMGWGVRDAGCCVYNRLSARRTVSSTAASGVSFKTAVTAFSAALLGNPSMTSAAVASS